MSNDNQAIAADTEVLPVPVEQSKEPLTELRDGKASPSTANVEAAKAEKQQLKALLAEARNTRTLMTDFKAAIHNGGSFPGHAMLSIAKGLAFLDAILEQNRTHIKNLEDRIEQ